MRSIGVIGAGQAGPAATDPRSIPEMVLAAVEAALDDDAMKRPAELEGE